MMKTWFKPRWFYATGVAGAAVSLSFQAWAAFSGGVVNWWLVVAMIVSIVVCALEFVRASKPNA
jgi:hypothetical protein